MHAVSPAVMTDLMHAGLNLELADGSGRHRSWENP